MAVVRYVKEMLLDWFRKSDYERYMMGINASFAQPGHPQYLTCHALDGIEREINHLRNQYRALHQALVIQPNKEAEHQADLAAWRAETAFDALIAKRDALLAQLTDQNYSSGLQATTEALNTIAHMIQIANLSKPR
jgi:hypothetical protein